MEAVYGRELTKHMAINSIASKRLTGRVAWVSGATSGIGEGVARLFAAEGARVAVVGRRHQLARSIAEEIVAAGGEAVGIQADVADEAAVKKSLGETVEHFGRLDILI